MATQKSFLITLLTGLLFTQSLKAIDPDKEYALTPDSVGWKYESIDIKTQDGFTLKSWIYEPDREKDRNTVLVLAGPDAGNMSYMVFHAWEMAKAGYTVITFDYRGFGKSDAFEIDKNRLYYTEFCKDLIAVVGLAEKKFQDEKIGIWALSMGTTITARCFTSIAEKIDFIVGDAFVTDTDKIVERVDQLKNVKLALPESSERYLRAVESIDVPLLIFAASEDEVTTVNDAHDLCAKLGGFCKVVEYEGNHLRGFQALSDKGFGDKYIEIMGTFLGN